MNFAGVCIFIAMLVAILCYVAISIKERSYLNFASPTMLLQFPVAYVLELGYLQRFDQVASDYAYGYLYACLALSNIVFTCAYIFIAPVKMPALRIAWKKSNSTSKAWLLLGLSAGLYSPILLSHPDLIARPREIYELTRTGFGLSFFLSSTLSFVGYTFYLCADRKNFLQHFLYLSGCIFLTLMHGSKGQILTYLFIYAIYAVYVRQYRVRFVQAIGYSALSAAVLIGLFYYFSVGIEASDLYGVIVAYSDYNRNAMLVIDTNTSPYWGRLIFDNEFFTRIPRLLYPGKPKDFGTFQLAKQFFPEAFELDQGAPAFGLGLFYADFREFTIFFLLATAAISGIMTRTAVAALRQHQDIFWLLVVIFFSGVALIPLGAGYLLPEHIVLGLLAGMFYRLRIGV